VNARHRARPLRGARTATLSELEMAVILLYQPAFHTIAATLTYAMDDGAVNGHRDNDFPKAIVLLIGVLSRTCRSLPKAEAMLRTPATWSVIRDHWTNAVRLGIAGVDVPDQLPKKAVNASHWRYMVRRLVADPEAFNKFCLTFTEVSIDLALELGYFKDGSLSNPALSSCLFADGTELRSQYRSYVEEVIDINTGEVSLVAIDPGHQKRVRAHLEHVNGRWIAFDPTTHKVLKKLPVDVEALASGKYGPTQAAYNVVPLSVRGEGTNSRVTLGIDMDFDDSQEAQTILRLFRRVVRGRLEGRVLAMITDLILRGMHQVVLFREYGVVTINKVAKASPSKEGQAFDVVDERDKRVKELPLGRFDHKREDGVTCYHTLQVRDGKIIDLDYNHDGSEQVVVGAP
jgi:hypothetical protein